MGDRRTLGFLLMATLSLVLAGGCASRPPHLVPTATRLVGTWSQPTTPTADIPAERVLTFDSDGSGSTFAHLEFNGPGMGKPYPFRYTVQGGRVQLKYSDGGQDTLQIDSISDTSFESTTIGESTHVPGGTWKRGSYKPSQR